MKELLLRPYVGKLYIAASRQDYERSHKRLFKRPDPLTAAQVGRFSGEGNDGMMTYLIWGSDAPRIAHELAHVILDVFQMCGIDPREAAGEPFCYMLSQLMMEAVKK